MSAHTLIFIGLFTVFAVAPAGIVGLLVSRSFERSGGPRRLVRLSAHPHPMESADLSEAEQDAFAALAGRLARDLRAS
ncbi:hypothetical protein G5C51_10815 [Streptomyces sp. A7024]|uniref:Uncharacterized protein n=1 Tax=Streptomyces coryli TaxID=1128680 RepID=A0A6G4TXY8_9ACTN|nr:hypothetical protein [Streptomyces coryli]NGN64390.1 hypothetical protein [Streptomyces coryli]